MIDLLVYLLTLFATTAVVVVGWMLFVAIVLTVRKRIREYATKWANQ
jgi:hypothetical protein